MLPARISLTFQGGFVGKRCAVLAQRPDSTWHELDKIFPEDVNRKQIFDLKAPSDAAGVQHLKLVFEESSDFFGRITVYNLSVEGTLASPPSS